MAMAPTDPALNPPKGDTGPPVGGGDTPYPWGLPSDFWTWLKANNPSGFTNAIADVEAAQRWYDQWRSLGETPDTDVPAGPSEQDRTEIRADILAAIKDSFKGIFSDAEINEIVNAIIEPLLLGEVSDMDIIRLIRQTDVYAKKFPGFLDSISVHPGMTEADYLANRDKANELMSHYFGSKVSDDQFGKLWAGDTSLTEFERRLQLGKQIVDMGGQVKAIFETEAGQSLTDEELYEFLSNEIDTPEFDRMYQDAYYKGYLNNLGVNREVTDQMVAELRKQGVGVDQAMKSYQQLAQSLPALDRLAALDASVAGDDANPYQTFNQAFRAFTLTDPDAQLQIGQAFAREVARFSGGGGATRDQRGRVSGLLSESERQRLG